MPIAGEKSLPASLGFRNPLENSVLHNNPIPREYENQAAPMLRSKPPKTSALRQADEIPAVSGHSL